MHLRTVAVLLSGAIGILVTGCSSTAPVMREQSPQPSFASWSSGPVMADGCPMCQSSTGPGGHVMHAANCDMSGASAAGAWGQGGFGHGGVGHGAFGHGGFGHGYAQGQGYGHAGGLNLPFHPVHRNFHTYHAPQGLMYPPENSAPAIVQYPYYTLRGPTDFFME